MTFDEARAMFPVLERVAYLNAGTFGPLARETIAVMLEQLERDLERGRSGKPYIDEMLEERARVRGAIAELLSADLERISLTASTTDGCNIVLLGLGLEPHDEIVTTDTEHFGLAGPVFASGATVRVARVQQLGAEEALEAIVAEVTDEDAAARGVPCDLDERRRVGRARVEGADGPSDRGRRRAVRRRDRRRRRRDRLLHGVGAEVALRPGVDRRSVRRRCRRAARRPSGLFRAAVVRARRPLRGARGSRAIRSRLDLVAALKGLAKALGLAPKWRFERIAEAAARCREALAERVRVVTPPGQAGLVTFEVEGDPEDVVAKLLVHDVVVRSVPGTNSLRASCGWWTSEDDIARLAKALSAEP